MKSYDVKRKKKEKRNQIIIAIFLSLTMVASMLGIMLNQDDTTTKYNGFKFRTTDNGYTADINGKEMIFGFLPEKVEQFDIPVMYCNNLQKATAINILFEPETQSLQFIDFIRLDFQDKFTQPILSSVTEKSNNYPTFNVASCDNASQEMPIIYFKESLNNSVSVENNCLIVESSGQSLIMFRDRILYCYAGVIN
jgi:hypothetical protein